MQVMQVFIRKKPCPPQSSIQIYKKKKKKNTIRRWFMLKKDDRFSSVDQQHMSFMVESKGCRHSQSNKLIIQRWFDRVTYRQKQSTKNSRTHRGHIQLVTVPVHWLQGLHATACSSPITVITVTWKGMQIHTFKALILKIYESEICI